MMPIHSRRYTIASPVLGVVFAIGLIATGLHNDVLAQAPTQATSAARPEYQQLKSKVADRFQVLLMRQSVVLVPRTPIKGVTNIELSDGLVLIDGNPVTGKELRSLIGADGDLVAQLSFVDAATRRQLFEIAKPPEQAAPATPAIPGAEAPPATVEPPATATGVEESTVGIRVRSGGSRVRIGGDVRVKEDEEVRNDVLAVIGSIYIDGRVDGEVVAVGGNVVLGPKSEVRGSVTSVGGAIERSAGSRIEGEVNEVRLSMPYIRPNLHFTPWRGWTGFSSTFGAPVALVGTLVRIGIIGLLAVLMVTVFPSKVQSVSDRIATEPWRAAVTGLAAQILFVPLLVLTVVVLAVSIIGIPLLLLVPFVVVALLAAFLLGFAGVGCAIGGQIGGKDPGSLRSLIVPLIVGLAVVWALTVIARFIGLAGTPLRFVVSGVLAVGVIIEYVAWTVGLGGVLLSRFGRRAGPWANFERPPVEPVSAEPGSAPPVPGL